MRQEAQEVTDRSRWDEVETLGPLLSQGLTLAHVADEAGVPESTLRDWVTRARGTAAPLEVIKFFESPAGLWVLHQIVVAAVFVLTQVAGGGVRSVCRFLELSGLWRFVASGYGSAYKLVKEMEEEIVRFGEREEARLGREMTPKEITVALDETFHRGEPCLVAIESSSGYILVELYADDRTTLTWAEKLGKGLAGFPVVEVIQATSDQGSSLIKLCKEWGIQQSPDLFHIQQDISRGTSLALEGQIKKAAEAAEKAHKKVHVLTDKAEKWAAKTGPGGLQDYEERISSAEDAAKEADEGVDVAQSRRDRVREAARGISTAYHPYDLANGELREAGDVKADVERHFDTINEIIKEAGLSDTSAAKVKKARKLLPKMVSTIVFVHSAIRAKLFALEISPQLLELVSKRLVPALYLAEVARKAQRAERRHLIAKVAAALRLELDALDSPWQKLSRSARDHIMLVALDCAQLFQRSSSAVEGRNSTLDLRHHGHRVLSARKLAAMTVLHNFFITRADSTTAAERFFAQRPRDIFSHLLKQLPPPRRPAAKRRTLH